jgi:transposase
MRTKVPQMPIRQLLSLCNQARLSNREISQRSGRHHSVINRVRRSISEGRIDLTKVHAMPDSEIWASITQNRGRQMGTFAEPDYPVIIKRLATRKYLKDELYCEYLQEFKASHLMSLRTFYRRIESFCASPKVTMRLSHKPGEVMQSDFTGDTCGHQVGHTLAERQMFVSTVGVSGLIFLKSTPDQKTDAWIEANNRALEFYGGVPPIWTMDNLKAAVIKNNAQGIVLNPVFEAMGHHYSASIQPARPQSPRDKGKVEAAVKLVQRAVRRVLRTTIPQSVEELDSLLLGVAEMINNRPMRGARNCSRREIFEEIDRPALGALPETPFLVQTIRRNVLVSAEYRVTEAQITYSVPYSLVGKRITLLISETHVTCVYDGQPVAVHPRGTAACEDFVKVEHMPEEHREYKRDPQQGLRELVEAMGHYASEFSTKAVAASPTLAGGQVIARKLKSIFRAFQPADVEGACEYALANGIQSREGILSVLSSRIWTKPLDDISDQPLPLHDNIRGEAYYQARRSSFNKGEAV